MKWITRRSVHVDRTACPWLIKKFIDPQAEFVFAIKIVYDVLVYCTFKDVRPPEEEERRRARLERQAQAVVR